MKGYRQKVGAWGENTAATYLEKSGYSILARNVRTPYGEIDLVAQKDDLTFFVEVKTRATNTFGPPEIAITPRKMEHMRAAAEHYAAGHSLEHWQLDVIAIEKRSGDVPKITHFENVSDDH
ncbi:MAG: YraN family protein [Anaerolineales bacterium]